MGEKPLYIAKSDESDAEISEIQHRLKNMLWTISGDYSLETEVDTALFCHSKNMALYDAVRKGGFQKFFKPELLEQYLEHIFLMGAEPSVVLPIAWLCIDSAVFSKVVKERPGVAELRMLALSDTIKKDTQRLTHTDWGALEECYLCFCLFGMVKDAGKQRYVERICRLQGTDSTAEVIRCLDEVYGQAYEKGFADKFKGFGLFYGASGEGEKSDFGELGEDGACEDDRIANLLTDSVEEDTAKKTDGQAAVVLADETIAQAKNYIELNYGKSYLTKQEQKRLTVKLCVENHKDKKLHFTEGLLWKGVADTFQAQYAKRVWDENREALKANEAVVRQNVCKLADTLRHALLTRDDKEIFSSECGRICIPRLWNVGRTNNRKLFEKEFIQERMDFVVEVLIDSSGSQQVRQSQVALQGYTISAALTEACLPHRVTGFCTFGDYTVLKRYRDYEDLPEADLKLLEFCGSANNRDGLAVRAAAHSLLSRKEERKILIILSDGVPNDIITGKSKSKDFIPYCREYAVKDTAKEVYRLRNKGISVMGIFVGDEEALGVEKQIFGNDFAYIRDVANFSNVVGRYLREKIIG